MHLDKQVAVRKFMVESDQEIPVSPSEPSLEVRLLRARLVLEEAIEFVHVSGFYIDTIDNIPVSMEELRLVPGDEPNLIASADALADSLYVIYGSAIAWGIDIDPVFAEVHRSNMTKFIDGYKDEHGKYRKGPSYSPPNIGPILHAQFEAERQME